jgi:Holliday junction resolvase
VEKIRIKEKEKDVQRAILDYLTLRGIFHYRNNSGAMMSDGGHFVRFGAVGSPDIVVVDDGIYIGVEVKGTNGKQSENQIAFQEELERAGGVYILAHSLDEFIKRFNSWVSR